MDRFQGEIKSQSDTIRINQKYYKQHVHDHYGNTGCGVFKRGVQN